MFQTGEAYHGWALIDRQHPHDLLMNLGARDQFARRGFRFDLEADVVGEAALGPTPFMHRESARENSQAPLTHHYLDSTHVSYGVLRSGIGAGAFMLDASWFRGEEPDDNRLNIDRPKLDSWAVRGAWHRGDWRAQVSGGHLHRPESFELTDMTRLTASIEYNASASRHPLAATLAWGENRDVHGIMDGYLLEWDLRTTARGAWFGRAELAAKDILNLGGPDPPGYVECHPISRVAALTMGYVHDVADRRWGRLGVGGDASVYHVPTNLLEAYGAPHSFHAFVRYRSQSVHRHE